MNTPIVPGWLVIGESRLLDWCGTLVIPPSIIAEEGSIVDIRA